MENLDLVLAASPLRDCSNDAQVETFKTPKRRSWGGEDRIRRLSRGSEERRPIAEAEMMSFEEMRKQLSLWQSHLGELAAEQREAERLRQAAGAALPGGSGSVATAA
ncbi:unnamed protein product [Effrenium voratum]|nr:unnamed protein product [Effrenium voratum]